MRLFVYIILTIWFLFFNQISYADEECTGTGCITSPNFTIDVWDITPGGKSLTVEWGGTKASVDNVLATLLNKLILMFGVLSVFIMTIGAGYMIIYHGQDEFLSKGKSIFVSGLIALAVALSAGLIVQLFSALLY